jgi:hypothetical protein
MKLNKLAAIYLIPHLIADLLAEAFLFDTL